LKAVTILAEGSVTVQVPDPIVCADATVNVNSVFWDNVPSGGTENVIVRQSTGATQVGSIQGQYFRIADSTAVLKDTLGTTISTTSIKAEDTEDIVAPDTTLEVNGTIEGTVVAGSTVDIQLSDSGGVVTPTSVTQVGTDFQVVLPDAAATPRSTATLMKTGQTTSYRTGDDGDIEAGRDTDFFTLDAAPLHNDGSATINTTTNRFTDELGGQTYANDIVLDWSTWNGSTLLGYSRVNIATGNTWEQAIDNSLTYSLGTFTSNWRLSNIKEIFNILNYQNTRTTLLNYAPLNLSSSSRIYWSSTTIVGTTTAVYAFSNTGLIVQQSKTSSAFFTYIPVRTFSLSTSNVLS
jgi:hypothetical protein